MIPKPFTNIALSLSGGGYRATAFHLGAMGYLQACNHRGKSLLEEVKVISTISGGTITGVMYTLSLARGEGYEQCFAKIYKLLDEDKLVEKALQKLNNPSTWKNAHKSRDVINAFAEVYNEDFYDEATFAELFDSDRGHIVDATFGSSEFTNGIRFRFQEDTGSARFGNGYLILSDHVARNIRLADATAASSCFPGGFEPMIMPHDFGNGSDSIVNQEWETKNYKPTVMMDGGIIDNQGIEGVKLAEERARNRTGHPYVGTYLVSDVCSDMMKPYEVPIIENNPWKNLFTIGRLNIFALIASLFLIVTLFSGPPQWATIACSIAMTITVIYYFIYANVKVGLKRALTHSFGNDAVPDLMNEFKVLQKTPIYILTYLIKFRITSVIVMVSSLFLRRIRRLQLDQLYADSQWNYRFMSNYIYTLKSKENDLSSNLSQVISMANNMPTTLWFTSKEKAKKMLDHLIASGQATMCYNLMAYIDKISTGEFRSKVWDSLEEPEKEKIGALYENMQADWRRFNKDPFWLLDKQKKDQFYPPVNRPFYNT